MAQIHLTPGMTLLEAYQVAQRAGMHLISNGVEVKVSPIIPPGWREIPLKVKVAAPDRGTIHIAQVTGASPALMAKRPVD